MHDEVLAHAVTPAIEAQRPLPREAAARASPSEAALAGFANSSTRSSPSSSIAHRDSSQTVRATPRPRASRATQ